MGAAEIVRFLPGLVRRETSEEAEAAVEAIEEIEEVSGTRLGVPTGETIVVIVEVSSPGSLTRGDAKIIV